MPRDSKLFSCFFLLTREYPWLSLVVQQGGEAWGSCPDAQGLQTFFLLLLSHENITLVESGHDVGRGGVGKLSRRPGTPNFVPASSFFRENNPGLVWSRSREGRGGEVVPTPRDSKLCSLLLPSHERITLVESGHAAGRGGVGKLSRRPGTPNFAPASSFSRENNPGISWKAAGRGGVGKFSRRHGNPNFVLCFFHLTRE